MTETYRGQADVARWCGVSTSAVSNWMRRHEGLYPEPDIEIVNVESGADDGTVIRGWKPERRPEWEKYAQENKRGRNAVAKRRAIKTAERIREMVEAGSIDPAEAVKLLVSLVGDSAKLTKWYWMEAWPEIAGWTPDDPPEGGKPE